MKVIYEDLKKEEVKEEEKESDGDSLRKTKPKTPKVNSEEAKKSSLGESEDTKNK